MEKEKRKHGRVIRNPSIGDFIWGIRYVVLWCDPAVRGRIMAGDILEASGTTGGNLSVSRCGVYVYDVRAELWLKHLHVAALADSLNGEIRSMRNRIKKLLRCLDKRRAIAFTQKDTCVKTWNGKCSNDGVDITVYHVFKEKDSDTVDKILEAGPYVYRFSDGWEITIFVKEVHPMDVSKSKLASKEFSYTWMIPSIIKNQKIESEPARRQ